MAELMDDQEAGLSSNVKPFVQHEALLTQSQALLQVHMLLYRQAGSSASEESSLQSGRSSSACACFVAWFGLLKWSFLADMHLGPVPATMSIVELSLNRKRFVRRSNEDAILLRNYWQDCQEQKGVR